MAYISAISKEDNKSFNSDDPEMMSKLSSKDKAILDQNANKESFSTLKKNL